MSFIIMGSCEDCFKLLNGYSQWLNIKGKNYFIETSVVLISVMLVFNHKKDVIKEI